MWAPSFAWGGMRAPSPRKIQPFPTPLRGPKEEKGFPGGSVGRESACNVGDAGNHKFSPWAGKIPWKRAWQPTLVFSSGEFHGQRSLVGYSPRGHKESDTTKATEYKEEDLVSAWSFCSLSHSTNIGIQHGGKQVRKSLGLRVRQI